MGDDFKVQACVSGPDGLQSVCKRDGGGLDCIECSLDSVFVSLFYLCVFVFLIVFVFVFGYLSSCSSFCFLTVCDCTHACRYLTAARVQIVHEWLASEAYSRGDVVGAFAVEQLVRCIFAKQNASVSMLRDLSSASS